jgi:hypothetical protein
MNPLTKRLAILLAISVGVNLLLGGFLLGRRFHGPAAVAPEHVRAIGMMRGKHGGPSKRPEWRAFQKQRRALSDRVAAALEHEPFDATELEAALSALRDETGRGQKTLHDDLVQRAKSGDAAFRKDLARAFRRAPLHGGD